MSRAREVVSLVVAAAMILFGLVVIARTVALGIGGGLGLLLGGLMVLGGVLRLVMVLAWRRG